MERRAAAIALFARRRGAVGRLRRHDFDKGSDTYPYMFSLALTSSTAVLMREPRPSSYKKGTSLHPSPLEWKSPEEADIHCPGALAEPSRSAREGGEHVEPPAEGLLLARLDGAVVHHLLETRRLLLDKAGVCRGLGHHLRRASDAGLVTHATSSACKASQAHGSANGPAHNNRQHVGQQHSWDAKGTAAPRQTVGCGDAGRRGGAATVRLAKPKPPGAQAGAPSRGPSPHPKPPSRQR